MNYAKSATSYGAERAVVLMRESDARDRGLKIHALLKSWAYSSDVREGSPRRKPKVRQERWGLLCAIQEALHSLLEFRSELVMDVVS
jgi:3-oxoacyl-(acyl-carrier-protein) synthase